MEKVSLNKFKDCIVDEKNNIVAEKPRWFDKHNWEQGEMLVKAFNKKLNLYNINGSLPSNEELQKVVERIAYEKHGKDQVKDCYAKMEILYEFIKTYVDGGNDR
jgi:hypothetical protein